MDSADNKTGNMYKSEEKPCIWIKSETNFLEVFCMSETTADIEMPETLILKKGI